MSVSVLVGIETERTTPMGRFFTSYIPAKAQSVYRRSSAFIGAHSGFALERLPEAKRVYEKTTKGRACLLDKNYITRRGLERLTDDHLPVLSCAPPPFPACVSRSQYAIST